MTLNSEQQSREDGTAALAHAIRELRRELKETQQQFANRLGLAMSSVVRYERGSRPEAAVLVKLLNLAEQVDRGDVAVTIRQHVVEHFGSFAVHSAADLRQALAQAEANVHAIPGHDAIPEAMSALESLRHATRIAEGIDPFFRVGGAE